MEIVSIITPAYKCRNTIEETYKSVLAQTFSDWEMIIIDDCSKDDTFNIASNYSRKDSRIRIIRNEVNSGVAATRNRGLDVALGSFIAFLDSDDIWYPEKLEKQIRFMEDNEYALTYTSYQNLVT